MSTDRYYIQVSDLQIEVVKKDIKNLHVGVYPPKGRVRVAAPMNIDDESVRLAVISKLSWIKKHQKNFLDQARQSKREMVDGESHYFQGQRYRLRVVEENTSPRIELLNKTIKLYVKPGTDSDNRNRLLQSWHRKELKKLLPDIIAKWEKIMGLEVEEWGIKKMKTKWGSCNSEAHRIWINLELSKKSLRCLEYIVVHEMVHFFERQHNDRFRNLMDQYMPNWKQYREELNSSPLSHESWKY